MTLIVGIEHRGAVVMGADSGIWDDFAHAVARPKIIRWPGLLVGVAGPLRPRNIIEHVFQPPEPAADLGAEEYLVREFVPALIVALTDAGCWKSQEGGDLDGCCGLAMLLGLSGHLYDLGSDLAVSRVSRPFSAVGQSAGLGIALGHLSATASGPLGPCDRVEAALATAADMCDRVRGPWHLEVLAA